MLSPRAFKTHPLGGDADYIFKPSGIKNMATDSINIVDSIDSINVIDCINVIDPINFIDSVTVINSIFSVNVVGHMWLPHEISIDDIGVNTFVDFLNTKIVNYWIKLFDINIKM